MRLSPKDISEITAALAPFMLLIPCKLYLFGSRVDPMKRGGDIDLLIVVNTLEDARKLRTERLDMSVSLQKHLGERRVDLTIATANELVTDPFLASIWRSAILITSH